MTAIDWNKPVQTKDGRKFIKVGDNGPAPEWPIVGYVEGWRLVGYWSRDGIYRHYTSERCTDDDLINVPQKHELWVNVYRNTSTGKVARVAFGTRPDADAGDTIIGSEWSRIACLHREFEEGKGLS